MQPFDPTRKCPKCGCGQILTTHCDPNERPTIWSIKSMGPCKDIEEEHLDRRCKRCRYLWQEKTLDNSPALHQLAMADVDNDEIVEDNPPIQPINPHFINPPHISPPFLQGPPGPPGTGGPFLNDGTWISCSTAVA